MDIQTATASDIYRALVDMQDRLMESAAEDHITLQRHLGQKHGTAGRAVEPASDLSGRGPPNHRRAGGEGLVLATVAHSGSEPAAFAGEDVVKR